MTVNIVALRLNKGLSRRQAAKEIGIARATLAAVEEGQMVHPGKAKLIADFYGVKVTDIVKVEAVA